MSFNTAKPSSLLAPYIKQYWAIENTLQPGDVHQQRIVPTGLLELSFYLADRPQSDAPSRSPAESTVLSGQQNRAYDLLVSGSLDLFSITFQPQGAMMFFNLPLDELCDQTIPLSLLDKPWVDQVEAELFEASNFFARVAVIETALRELLIENHRIHDASRIGNSIQLINLSKGMIEIDRLASKACLSRKQFERVFQSCIGTSPKRFLRTVRFQHALFLRQHNQGDRLTDLAYACGYYDQSHMIHDFRALSGMSPSKYFRECEPESDYFV